MVIKIEKSLLKILAVIAIAAIAGVVWAKRTSLPVSRFATPTPAAVQPSTSPVSQSAAASSGMTKENSEGEVTVSVTPAAASDTELGFDIAINTHTADMSAFDPEKQIVLMGADGRSILPSNVIQEGSGHHQELQTTFPKLEAPWKLVVLNVGGIPAREFLW